ncbi:MAG: hypothetical protein AAFO29_22140 [Actinomycetota bacterium]
MSTTRRYVSPKREAKAAATRQAILEAFRDQMMEPGRDSLSPTDAAATVGCSVRTVHGHFPTGESRIEALAALLEEELYDEHLVLPANADDLADYYRTIHQVALDSPVTEALVSRPGEWRQVRSRRRADRLEAVRQVVADIGAPAERTEEATAVLLSLAGGEVTLLLRDQGGLAPDRIPDALAHTVELIVADLRQAAAGEGGDDG